MQTTYKEVFQLAQDKGYKLRIARGISDTGLINTADYLWGDEEEVKNCIKKKRDAIKEISLIELTLIQKLLRDEYNIDIYYNNTAHFGYSVLVSQNAGEYEISIPHNLPTYEQALLEGIKEALNLLP